MLMMENAIYSTISPEDAAELIYQDETRADEVAESLRLTAQDCRELGIVDVVVPEPPGGAHTQPDESARQLRRVLLQELADLQAMSRRRMIRNRYKKFRKMGNYTTYFEAALAKEVDRFQNRILGGLRDVWDRVLGRPTTTKDRQRHDSKRRR